MNYNLIRDVITLLQTFENKNKHNDYAPNTEGFCQWLINEKSSAPTIYLDYEGKADGRSIESVISTLLVHMNKYAKSYSRSAIYNSEFSTQEEFIFLITLKSFGAMSKMELIRKNKMDKPSGIQIINRLIKCGWVVQIDSTKDKRSKILDLTQNGRSYLAYKMEDIRKATKIVTADLSENEKYELVRILTKMDKFHQTIYNKNLQAKELLNDAYDSYTIANNPK